jgi:hypothetical protein
MSRSKTTTRVCALFVAPLLAFVAACGATGPEQTLVRTYFNASNVTDRGSLANITMYAWNVREKGTVTGPTVNSVSEERSRPLRVKELEQAVIDAQAAEETFTQEKVVYQNENFDAINRVLEAEREEADVASGDSEVQEAWTDWRARTMANSKAVSDSQQAVSAERNTAYLSVQADDPDLSQFDGQIVSKDADVTATVTLDGNASEQQLTVTLQRTILENGEEPIEGRWVIANIN